MGDGLLKRMAGAFGALVAPESCASCRGSVRRGEGERLCGTCVAQIVRAQAPLCACCGLPLDDLRVPATGGSCADCAGGRSFEHARTYGLFEGLLRDLVRRLKYQGDKELAEPLGHLMLAAAQQDYLLQDFDAIVPVPLHRDRFMERGFNQCYLLSRPVAREGRIPIVPALERRRNATTQVGLQGAARRANVAGVFTVHPRRAGEISRRRILLVDDVITTGATAESCAEALLKAGAKAVDVLAVARTP